MKQIIRELAKNFGAVDQYLKDECIGQAEAACKIIVFDILDTIMKDESLGSQKIELVKKIAAKYNINI
jgi:hypothetical protein